jgi:hypothetical protein
MRRLSALCPLLLGLMPANAQAHTPAEAWQPPVLTTERYNEDWSNLADPAKRSGHWTDKLKYIPLDDTGRDYLTTGLELRLRNEDYQNNALGNAAAPNDGYLWTRLLPYADLHLGLGKVEVRAFAQPIIAYAAGVAPSASAIDQTRVDTLQAFADVVVPLGSKTTLRLRGGREMMSLGTERLIGTRYGPNVPLAFDGGRAIVHRGKLTVNAFYLRPVEPGQGTFDDHTSQARALWGVYATQLIGSVGVDVYWLDYRNDLARFQNASGREIRRTAGLRFFGKLPVSDNATLHWNTEAMLQSGHLANQTIHAWSVGSEAGVSLTKAPLKPDLTLRFNVASGDKNPGDHRFGTFNALFPKGKYFGELSPIGPYNLVNVQPVLGFDLGQGVGLSLAAGAYWRQSRGDGVYDIPGHLLVASDAAAHGGTGRFLGNQAETSVEWRATQELTLSASLSLFRSGGFLREAGFARTIHMAGLEANYRL